MKISQAIIQAVLHMKKGDTIVCAYAGSAFGPGWANTPLFVIIRSQTGGLREECLQPDDQPRLVADVYRIAAEVHKILMRALLIPDRVK